MFLLLDHPHTTIRDILKKAESEVQLIIIHLCKTVWM